MFVIFGSDDVAIELAEWIGTTSRVRLIGLADQLKGIPNVEIVTLPTEMELNEMPLPDLEPTAVVILEEIICDDNPGKELKEIWPNTPILSTIEIENSEFISVNNLMIQLLKNKLKSIDRNQGATDVVRRLKMNPDANVLIVCHDNPDPDSLASAMAIKQICDSIGQNVTIAHGGLIEHQQNIGMVNLLELDLRRIILSWEIDDLLQTSDIVICVDFNKAGANNVLPEYFIPTIIIDHHLSETRPPGELVLVRPEFAATSSLVATIAMNSNIEISPEIATALAFGIRTDTLGFTRSFNEVDLKALSWLNKHVDWELLRSFESPPRTLEVLEIFKNGLNDLKIIGNLALAPIYEMANRDALSQVADFLLPTEGVTIVVAYGIRRNKVILSARSSDNSINIGKILAETFPEGTAGGHKVMAGGQIPIDDLSADSEKEAMDKIENILSEIFVR